MTRSLLRIAVLALAAAFPVLLPRAARAQEQATPPEQARDTTRAEAPARPGRVRRDANRITREELTSRTFQNAHEAVQSLRPLWLRVRGSSSVERGFVPARVYQNGMPAGGPAALTGMRVESIESIEFLRAADATTRYGDDHSGGAILVKLIGSN